MSNISQIRKDYKLEELKEELIHSHPIIQFNYWLNEAINANVNEPTAFCLSTVSEKLRPSARIVLLKGIEEEQFIFFTNYNSRKGKELAANTFAAFTFFWPELERQVRIEGVITQVDPKASDIYFSSRPYESQIGAIVSPQSQVIKDKEALMKELSDKIISEKDKKPQRPAHWGGYQLKPDYFEFWQGRPGRFHDRISYSLSPDGQWNISRLAP